MKLLDVILQQNNFSCKNDIYQPETGVSMGSPISSTIAEILLQHLVNTLRETAVWYKERSILH